MTTIDIFLDRLWCVQLVIWSDSSVCKLVNASNRNDYSLRSWCQAFWSRGYPEWNSCWYNIIYTVHKSIKGQSLFAAMLMEWERWKSFFLVRGNQSMHCRNHGKLFSKIKSVIYSAHQSQNLPCILMYLVSVSGSREIATYTATLGCSRIVIC